MGASRGSPWYIDKVGVVHWPGLLGQTFCRRSTKGMERRWADGTLQLSCAACSDLRKQQLRTNTAADPWKMRTPGSKSGWYDAQRREGLMTYTIKWDSEIHAAAKKRAAELNQPLNQYIITLVQNDIRSFNVT